ncbi:MAG: hypothetical protein ABI968_00185 [Acidobacteriota bacterium]
MLCARAAPGFEIRVSPAQAETHTGPGGQAEVSFRLRSVAGEGKIRPSFADFDLDEDGNPVAGGARLRSCASWARADRNELALGTGDEVQLRVGLQAPPTASGTYWCLLTLDMEGLSSPARRGNVVQVLPRLSVPLLVSVGAGPAPRITARFEKISRQDSELASSLVLEAEGAYAMHVTGSIALEEESGSGPVEIGRLVVPRSLLLPGHRRRVPVRIACRSKRPVRLRGILDYGDPEQKTVEIDSGPVH